MHRLLRFDWRWLIEMETAIVLLNAKKAKTLNERGRRDRGGCHVVGRTMGQMMVFAAYEFI
ncbi:hypothetical protein Hanom_Chr08g00735761 [Helianthus anomalus]